MAGRPAIGLDIGSSAVRAAQLSQSRGAVVLDRFGEVPLKPGAVRDGEVVDGDAVVSALKELWRQSGFSGRKVVLGVANQKVVVRQVDLPWMPRNEIRQSLPFHVQDFIPMPVEAAVLDFLLLGERTDEGGKRTMDGLLVAAAREMVLSIADTAEAAGLRPVAVDLSSFALVRALAWPTVPAAPGPPPMPPPGQAPASPPGQAPMPPPMPAGAPPGDTAPQESLLSDTLPLPPDSVAPPAPVSVQAPPMQAPGPEPPPVEAIVDVGARVTNVVVHRGGVPLFVRILLMGAQNIVEAVSERTGADPAQAEETVRTLGLVRADVTHIPQTEPAARAIDVAGTELVDEVRGSLDYFVASSGSSAVSHLLLSGGGARIGGLAQRLSEVTRTAVDYAHPLAGLTVGRVRVAPEMLAYLEPATSVAIGLARGAAA